jgi:TPR repeat protein
LAVNVGQPEAEILLGVAYNKGLGVEKNDKEAFNWYQKAAQQGNWRGQYILGHYCPV